MFPRLLTATFLLALAPALAVIGLHYLWVVRAAVAVEDAAIDQAQRRHRLHALLCLNDS